VHSVVLSTSGLCFEDSVCPRKTYFLPLNRVATSSKA